MLVGQFGDSKTLIVENEFNLLRDIRVYAFCTKFKNSSNLNNIRKSKIEMGLNYTSYDTGSVTLLILNLQNNSVSFDIDLIPLIVNTSSIYYDEYILTSYPNVVNSRDIFLNGKLLQMIDNTTFPNVIGVRKEYRSTVEMPALSYGFVVIANAQAGECIQDNNTH